MHQYLTYHLSLFRLKYLFFSALLISLLSNSLPAAKINVDEIDEYGRTPLHLAILDQDEELVEKIVLSQKADLNARDQKGQTPLIYASAKDYPFTVQLLLAHGADVNATDNIGRTALSFAAGHASLHATFILLRHDNTKVDLANNYGVTPLMYAVGPIRKNKDKHVMDFIRRRMIIQFLIMSGADTKAQTNAGLMPKDYAKINRQMAESAYRANTTRYKLAHKKRYKKPLVTAEEKFAEHLTTLLGQKPADFSQTYFDLRGFLFRKSISLRKGNFKEWSDLLLSLEDLISED